MLFFFKDIPPPSFLLTKEEDDWTEDDRKILADYEKRVKELEEEREKYRKVCDTIEQLSGIKIFISAIQISFHNLFCKNV